METKKRINISIPLRWPSGQAWKRLARWLLPTPGTIVFILVLLWAQSAGALPLARQAVPASPSTTTVNYQGRLADSGGTPIDGLVTLQFALYANDVDPNPLWGPETHPNVPVSDGLFSVILGSQLGGIPQNILGGDLWLEIIVNGETLSPRERLGSVPYAMQADLALTVPDGAIESRNARLSIGQVTASIPGGVLELTDEYQDVPGTAFTLTPETDQTYLLYITADFYALNALATARLLVDGEFQGGTLIFQSYAGSYVERATVSQTYLVNLEVGAHTIVLRARRNSGTTAKVGSVHTRLTYFAVSQ